MKHWEAGEMQNTSSADAREWKRQIKYKEETDIFLS